MIQKRISLAIIALLLFAQFFVLASAISIRVGDTKMIIRADIGDTVDRSIRVGNVNDFPVVVTFNATGDLADYIKLENDVMILQPGEETRNHFTIKAAKPGTTETRVVVTFEQEDGEGVPLALPSVIYVITEEEDLGLIPSLFNRDDEDPEENQGVSVSQNKENPEEKISQSSSSTLSFSPVIFLGVSTLILAVLLVFLFTMLNKKGGSTKPKKSASTK